MRPARLVCTAAHCLNSRISPNPFLPVAECQGPGMHFLCCVRMIPLSFFALLVSVAVDATTNPRRGRHVVHAFALGSIQW